MHIVCTIGYWLLNVAGLLTLRFIEQLESMLVTMLFITINKSLLNTYR